MAHSTVCKFRCTELRSHNPTENVQVRLEALYDEKIIGDASFSKYTPSGHLEAQINNPAVLPMFALGKAYYVTIEEEEAK